MNKLPQRLRKLRNERGLSMSQLAAELGTSKSSIAMYERGEREPGIPMIISIAVFFLVSIDYLVGMSDDRTPEYIALEDYDALQRFRNLAPLEDLSDAEYGLKLLLHQLGEDFSRHSGSAWISGVSDLSDQEVQEMIDAAVEALRPKLDAIKKRAERDLRRRLAGEKDVVT